MKTAVALAAGMALFFAPLADAKDGLLFDRGTARVGERMTLTTSWMNHPAGVIVYFMPLAVSPKWWPTYQAYAPARGRPPALKSAVRVGHVKRWRSTGGRLEFLVPRVTPGRYVLGFWCQPCDTHWTSALPNFQPDPRGILTVRP
jgi:hypothetical protein